MCFKNLPIEFDAQGKPFLRAGIADPYAPTTTAPRGAPMQLSADRIEELLQRNGYIKDLDFDPVTRVAGALAFHTVADFQDRKVLEARSVATLFRGYEVIMIGRDPRDAIFITSRACGVCGGVHSVTSAMAIEMAIGCVPPPLGILIRNLALALEFLYDHPLHLHLLAGPDYSAAMVGPTNPSLLDRARRREAPGAAIHGFRTMGDLMEDLNPLSGKLYLEALHMTRVAREAYVLICGKYPHPQTIVPGGMSSTITLTVMNEMFTRLAQFFDYSKKLAAIWDDMTSFFYAANPAYQQVGAAAEPDRHRHLRPPRRLRRDLRQRRRVGRAPLGDAGRRSWTASSSPPTCTRSTSASRSSSSTRTTRSGPATASASASRPIRPGNPLSPYHPWNKVTKPRPQGRAGRRSTPGTRRRAGTASPWRPAPTRACGIPPSRASCRRTPSSRRRAPRSSSRLPKGALPELELEWHVPTVGTPSSATARGRTARASPRSSP